MILYVFGGIYMKKLRVTLTSLGVAAGILVGGYTIVKWSFCRKSYYK